MWSAQFLMSSAFIPVDVEVEFDYDAELPDELTIRSGQLITDVKQMDGGWWEGTLKGKRGVFPDNFVKVSTIKPLLRLRNHDHALSNSDATPTIRRRTKNAFKDASFAFETWP